MINQVTYNISYFVWFSKQVESSGEQVFILLDLLIPPLPLSPLQGAALRLQMTANTKGNSC